MFVFDSGCRHEQQLVSMTTKVFMLKHNGDDRAGVSFRCNVNFLCFFFFFFLPRLTQSLLIWGKGHNLLETVGLKKKDFKNL